MISRAMVAVVLALWAADPAVMKEIEQFRAKHEEDYRRQFVTLAGLSSIKDGVNTVGSASSNAVVLPKGAPPSVGRLVVTGNDVRFQPAAGVKVTMKEQPVTTSVDLTSDEKGPADELAVGGITFWVHMSGDRRTIRMRDENGEPARTFEGFKWFPIDERYRVSGRFIKDPTPRLVQIPNQLGDEETYTNWR